MVRLQQDAKNINKLAESLRKNVDIWDSSRSGCEMDLLAVAIVRRVGRFRLWRDAPHLPYDASVMWIGKAGAMLVVTLAVAMTIALLIAIIISLREEAEPNAGDDQFHRLVMAGAFADRAGGRGAPAHGSAFIPAAHPTDPSACAGDAGVRALRTSPPQVSARFA